VVKEASGRVEVVSYIGTLEARDSRQVDRRGPKGLGGGAETRVGHAGSWRFAEKIWREVGAVAAEGGAKSC
jgi:hypothetical protein